MRKVLSHCYKHIISVENLLEAWREFKRGKGKKEGVQRFEMRLMERIFSLHNALKNKTYKHLHYKHFKISDPKPRDIHKASVRDRVLHRAVHRVLYPFFDRKFIADSFSCRNGKGTHRALDRFRQFGRQASANHTKTVYVLKCDIRKFFANIDHEMLKEILAKHIEDKDVLWLLSEIVGSFNAPPLNLPLKEGERKTGLPLGNLTSQLLVNIYMNEFDQFVKHKLKCEYYIRYADDFVVLSQNKNYLLSLITAFQNFLSKNLKLTLRPDKVFIRTLASGVDFLGWVHFPTHRILRTATKQRMLARVNEKNVSSYLGLCKHGNSFALANEILRRV